MNVQVCSNYSSLWCTDCRDWVSVSPLGAGPWYVCDECGDVILCGECGQAFTLDHECPEVTS